jgi:hypothetical protein
MAGTPARPATGLGGAERPLDGRVRHPAVGSATALDEARELSDRARRRDRRERAPAISSRAMRALRNERVGDAEQLRGQRCVDRPDEVASCRIDAACT